MEYHNVSLRDAHDLFLEAEDGHTRLAAERRSSLRAVVGCMPSTRWY